MDIIVTGSIAYDYLMRFPGRFNDYFIDGQMHQVSLSFLVEEMTKHWGGIGANIAYTLGLLGHQAKLMGTVGRDFGDYREWLERVGVNTSGVREFTDVFTASYFANTDLDLQLKQHGIRRTILIGMIANTCLEATGRFGMELGYHITLVTDATAAFTHEAMEAAHRLNGPTFAHAILTSSELSAQLEN